MQTDKLKKSILLVTIAMSIVAALGTMEPAHAIRASYLYDLSTFTGPLSYDGASIYTDKDHNEAYVVSRGEVQVFNENGMEVYQFTEGDIAGAISALAFDKDGFIYALTYKYGYIQNVYEIQKCNYRGEPISSISVQGIPAGFKDFMPRYMALREGQFYLADPTNLYVVVTDMNGSVQKSYDLISLLELKESERGETELGGFSVDNSGNMLFTVTVLFSASIVSPSGKIETFGQPGSIPGKFANVAGIVRDSRGNILVADRLKSVVNIFDKNLNFLAEFGGRGNAPGNLVVPSNLAVDGNDRLYVTQASNRGVSVFRLEYN